MKQQQQKSSLTTSNGGRRTPESFHHHRILVNDDKDSTAAVKKKVTIGAIETASTKTSMPVLERVQTSQIESSNESSSLTTPTADMRALRKEDLAYSPEDENDYQNCRRSPRRKSSSDLYLPVANNEKLPLSPRGNIRNQVGLSWRSDALTSFSDWTLEIVALREEKEIVSKSTYYCHSNVLAWGPRKCEKFIELFQERMKRIPPSGITRIRLQENVAKVFPMLLDFLYCEINLPLSSGYACALYDLADQFDVPELLTAIQSFIEKALDLKQSIEFLSTAKHYENKSKVEKLVLFANSKLCAYLVKNPDDAAQVPPDLLAHMLIRRTQCIKVLKGEDPRKYSGEWEIQRSELLSIVVAKCCKEAVQSKDPKKKLTRKIFERLVHPTNLPAVDATAALMLLRADHMTSVNENGGFRTDERVNPQLNDHFSLLENRCLNALAEKWRQMYRLKRKTIIQELKGCSPHILAELLVLVSHQYEDSIKKAEKSTLRMEHLFQRLSLRQTRHYRNGHDDGIDLRRHAPCPEGSWGEATEEARALGNQICGDLVDMVQTYRGDEDDSFR